MARMMDAFASPSQVRSKVHIPLNVEAEDDDYVITAFLPGLESEDVSIQVLDDVIAIRGELKSAITEDGTYLMKELPAGEFYRAIRLPVALDTEKAEAAINNGILSLRVPKAETAKPKTIEVIAK
jgi:HSP20 family protein